MHGHRRPVIAARIGAAAATALVAAAALHRIAGRNPHLTLPAPPVVAALAMALAMAAFASRLWGAILLVPVALLSLPWFGHPAGLVAALLTAGLSVAEVALWSIWLPVTVRSASH